MDRSRVSSSKSKPSQNFGLLARNSQNLKMRDEEESRESQIENYISKNFPNYSRLNQNGPKREKRRGCSSLDMGKRQKEIVKNSLKLPINVYKNERENSPEIFKSDKNMSKNLNSIFGRKKSSNFASKKNQNLKKSKREKSNILDNIDEIESVSEDQKKDKDSGMLTTMA